MTRTRKVSHQSASMRIVDTLRQRILTGELTDGTKLAEREIADEFGTSRVPVREAFKVLESEGYLEVRPRSGTAVKPIVWKDLRTVGDVYIALIPLIILYALPHYTEKLLKKAEGIITDIETSENPVDTIGLLTNLRDLLHSPSTDTYAYKVCRDIYLINRRILATVSHNLYAGTFPTERYRKFIAFIRAKQYDEAVMVYTDIVRQATMNMNSIIKESKGELS